MKNKFEIPELTIIMFKSDDVIRTSDPFDGVDDNSKFIDESDPF